MHFAFVHRALVHKDAGRAAAVLKVVVNIVLDLGDIALALRALDFADGHRTGQILVFAERLKVAPGRRDDDLVHHGPEPDILERGATRGADSRAIEVGRAWVPASGETDRCGHCRFLKRQADTGRAIRQVQRRNAEPCDAEDGAGFACSATRRAAVDKAVLFRHGHLRDQAGELGVG